MKVLPEAPEMTVFRDAGERLMRSGGIVFAFSDAGADIFAVTLLSWKNDGAMLILPPRRHLGGGDGGAVRGVDSLARVPGVLVLWMMRGIVGTTTKVHRSWQSRSADPQPRDHTLNTVSAYMAHSPKVLYRAHVGAD